jgi:tRNA(fMet)-specific endonuclease VapC
VPGRYLLDSVVAIEYLRGRDPELRARVNGEGELYLNVVILGELFFGAANSDYPERNLERVGAFASGAVLLTPDAETALRYGTLKSRLSKLGRLIPENDMWIAATALEHDLTLVTRDGHFEQVEGLRRERW